MTKIPKFGRIGASFILKFGEIRALQNSGNLLEIRRDWSLPFGEIGVPPKSPLSVNQSRLHFALNPT